MSSAGEGFAHPEFLVEGDWLAAHLDDPELRIFDCTIHLIPNPDIGYTVKPGREDFEQGHIPGARSIPVAALERRLAELPSDREVVAYCRGPYCVYADDAVRQLHRSGRRAARLQDGYPEWARAGLPVATADA